MGRPKKYADGRVTTTFSATPALLEKLDMRVGEQNLSSRNDLLTQILNSAMEGGESADTIRARIEEGYCDNHHIAVIDGKVMSFDCGTKLSDEAIKIHLKTLSFLSSVYLG